MAHSSTSVMLLQVEKFEICTSTIKIIIINKTPCNTEKVKNSFKLSQMYIAWKQWPLTLLNNDLWYFPDWEHTEHWQCKLFAFFLAARHSFKIVYGTKGSAIIVKIKIGNSELFSSEAAILSWYEWTCMKLSLQKNFKSVVSIMNKTLPKDYLHIYDTNKIVAYICK